eukprot:CAMPEP_0184335914 /NCGR_PEP_ID=MMETSP1089-20130417/4412_1 /TAXON_ID=38269 ORGANISM="Gloeochaete wittrockiana, Strain SAG46.84" /NCGR_SAMPLE_ID=MMETSP1089 /ASSEMBLY_ACC=CAM_ASM_000445 /LENGTH=421 /DNA_ID=CAMNT_0026660815 /DNA_START=76 /DNA_END=1341 /DNA_ORIENTATION=+
MLRCANSASNSLQRTVQWLAGARSYAKSDPERTAVIVSAKRTPIGTFNGNLSSFKGSELGSLAIKAAVSAAGIDGSIIQEAFLGNVVGSGMGQAPARQAVIYAGLPNSVACTTVNKVCASGLKTIIFASQSIQLGQRDVVLAGGFESMSNIPYYLPKARGGYKLGHGQVLDGIITDGLWDVYNDHHMGICAEVCAKEYSFTREQQDAYAIESYKRAAAAWEAGHFKNEIVPVTIKGKKGDQIIDVDEEYTKIDFAKLPTLRPAFDKNGSVTAANSSSINDGAAALIVMSQARAESLGLKPLAKILGYGDAEKAPVEFTTAPSDAIPRALQNAGVTADEVDLWEINEAFSVVALANMHLLNLDHAKVNIYGGAVALGHPIGCSGARIVVTLINALKQQGKRIGSASICNGGGGASAIVIENL